MASFILNMPHSRSGQQPQKSSTSIGHAYLMRNEPFDGKNSVIVCPERVECRSPIMGIDRGRVAPLGASAASPSAWQQPDQRGVTATLDSLPQPWFPAALPDVAVAQSEPSQPLLCNNPCRFRCIPRSWHSPESRRAQQTPLLPIENWAFVSTRKYLIYIRFVTVSGTEFGRATDVGAGRHA
jgi:hypothetical protein